MPGHCCSLEGRAAALRLRRPVCRNRKIYSCCIGCATSSCFVGVKEKDMLLGVFSIIEYFLGWKLGEKETCVARAWKVCY